MIPGDSQNMRRRIATAALAILCFGCDDTGTPLDVTGLRFVAAPVGAVAGTGFSVSVEMVDAGGNRVRGAGGEVSLSVNGEAVASGVTSATAIDGVATFPGVVIVKAGTEYALTATAG